MRAKSLSHSQHHEPLEWSAPLQLSLAIQTHPKTRVSICAPCVHRCRRRYRKPLHAFDRYATFRPETSTNAPEELHEIAAFLRRVRAPEEGCGQLGCVLDQPQLIVQLHHHVAGHASPIAACMSFAQEGPGNHGSKDESRSIQRSCVG